MVIPAKTCSCCGLEKPIDGFQVRKASKDGYTASCKECLSVRDAERYKREAERRARQHAEYMRTENGKAAHARAARLWRKENPQRRAAQVVVGNAVRCGSIKPEPCFVCGKTAEAHHPDYSRPLDVVWLCPAHHKQAHALGNQLLKGNP